MKQWTNRRRRNARFSALAGALVVLLGGCGKETGEVREQVKATPVTAAALADKRVFFGHKSVGADVIQGIKEMIDAKALEPVRIVTSCNPESVAGPGIIECQIGTNRQPETKDKAFADVIAGGYGSAAGIAIYKYCYLDIHEKTDIDELFQNYSRSVEAIKRQYPLLKVVHTTVPLTTVEPGAKAWLKGMLGKPTLRAANIKRNRFNERLRQKYGKTDPIFDLAETESTRPDGSRAYFEHEGQRIYFLAEELARDSGHLNATGRKSVAEAFLRTIAAL